MRILLLVHIEETFRKFFDDDMLCRITEAIDNEEYDKVYHFTSGINDFEPVEEIRSHINEFVDWAWGYEPEAFEHDPDELQHIIESSGHEYTWVPPELRDSAEWLRHTDITIGGGYDGECLTDMECVLRHLEIPYKRRRDFIY